MDSKLFDTFTYTFRRTSNKSDELELLFLDLYKQRNLNKTISGFLIQHMACGEYLQGFEPSRDSNSLDLDFLPCKTRVVASSEQGIVVFESPDPRNKHNVLYHVCKPTTRQILALPNPKMDYYTEKAAIIVMSSIPLRYKIVRLSKPKDPILPHQGLLSSSYRYEIFDSRTCVWRLLTDTEKLPFRVSLVTNPQPITIGSSIYMLMATEVLQFDANLEKWKTFGAPMVTIDYPFYTPRQLVKYEGKLGLVCRSPNGGWHFWVRTLDDSWDETYIFCNGKYDNIIESLDGLYDSDMRIMMDSKNLVYYKVKRDKYNYSGKLKLRDERYEIFVFRSDFEIVDLIVGQKLSNNI